MIRDQPIRVHAQIAGDEAHHSHSIHVICDALWTFHVATDPSRPFGHLNLPKNNVSMVLAYERGDGASRSHIPSGSVTAAGSQRPLPPRSRF